MIFRLALASAFLLSNALATDFTISVAGTPVTVNGFTDDDAGEELTMSFVLADGAGVTDANVACATHEIAVGSPNQCDTTTSLAAVIATKKNLVTNAQDVGIDIDLTAIGTSNG